MALPKPTPLPSMKFRMASTGCEIVLVHLKLRENANNTGKLISRPIYEFKYTNRPANKANGGMDKPNFTTYIEEIEKAVKMQRWIKI